MKRIISGLTIICAAAILSACKEEDPQYTLEQLDAQQEAFDARVAELTDSDLHQLFGESAWFYFTLRRMEVEQLTPPGEVQYDEDPFRWLTPYETPQATFDAFLSGLFITNDPPFRDTIDIRPPFPLAFPHTLAWNTVTLRYGDEIEVSDEFNAQPPVVSVWNAGNRLKVEVETDLEIDPPTQISGQIIVQLPSRIERLSFTRNDVGTVKTVGQYQAKLVKLDQHLVQMEITRQDGGQTKLSRENLIVGAKDQTGQYLSRQSGSMGHPEFLQSYFTTLDTALTDALSGDFDPAYIEARLKEQMTSLDAENTDKLYVSFTFRGEIEQFLVALMTDTSQITRDLNHTIVNFDASNDYDQPVRLFPTTTTVRDVLPDHILNPTGPSDLPADQAKQAVTFTGIDNDFRYHSIDFIYPEMPSSMFLDGFDRFDYARSTYTLNFFDTSARQIEFPQSDPYDLPYKLNVKRIEFYPEKFPRPPERVTGSMQVYLAPNMQYMRAWAGNLPQDLDIQDNMVLRSGRFGRDDIAVFALDADGQPLRKFNTTQYYRRNDPTLWADYYYGEPRELIIVEQGELQEITVNFDLRFDLEKLELIR